MIAEFTNPGQEKIPTAGCLGPVTSVRMCEAETRRVANARLAFFMRPRCILETGSDILQSLIFVLSIFHFKSLTPSIFFFDFSLHSRFGRFNN